MVSRPFHNWLIAVPVRMEATRLPNKPLLDLAGKPLVVRVCENLRPMVEAGATLIVATDSDAIRTTCEALGYQVQMTSSAHRTGTDRVREAASHFPHAYCMNVQGDDPFVTPSDLMRLMETFEKCDAADMGTLFYRSTHMEDFATPSAVKIVCDAQNFALYFSRSPIPYPRVGTLDHYRHHLGIYAFKRESLHRYGLLPSSPLEQRESLEQLRLLENGMRILCVEADHTTLEVNTPEDLEQARKMLQAKKK
jgi:3-deoxy-manno-octulosonate cytidylyltransferase (CMP-KDO synthetase)